MRNLTPLHLRCAAMASCPSITQMDSGEYLIVGKSASMAAACDRIPVGEGEHAVIVSGELLAGVVPGWKTIDSAPRDGTPVLLCDARTGSMRWAVWAIHPDHIGSPQEDFLGWRDGTLRAGGTIVGLVATHWMPLPAAPQGYAPSDQSAWQSDWTRGSTWRHVKSGRVYKTTGRCRLEATGEPAVLYVLADGANDTVWARSQDEFLDGRFERVDPLPPAEKEPS